MKSTLPQKSRRLFNAFFDGIKEADIHAECSGRHIGLATADRGMEFLGPFLVGERQQPPANDVQMSIRSAMLSASSSSTPR